MKKGFSALLSALMLLLCAVPVFAEEAHVHRGKLEALVTASAPALPRCGVFRCEACGETYEASVGPEDVGLPVVEIAGSLEGISKENKVTARIFFADGVRLLESAATLKWQGSTSLSYPKKNYNIQFLTDDGGKNKVALVPAWGKQSKYTLKANWVDLSAARNLVSAKLFGEIVHSRCLGDPLDGLVNGGAVDGFPVVLYHDGEFLGLYTFNTPKDNWIFGMSSKKKREGMLFADDWSASTRLRAPIPDVNDPGADGWEIEYCSTEDDPAVGTAWLVEGMDRFIRFIVNSSDEEFRENLGSYTDVSRCIDYMLFLHLICAGDNVAKNTMWVTYDGVKYVPSAYDLDGTWGMRWNGEFPDLLPAWSAFTQLRRNRLFSRLLDNFFPEFVLRYAELRRDVLSKGNLTRLFSGFTGEIPDLVYRAETEKWPAQPGVGVNDLSQILTYMDKRIDSFDSLCHLPPVDEKDRQAYRVNFACENGAKIRIFTGPDLSAVPVRAADAFSTDPVSGALTKENGEAVFLADVPEGERAEVAVFPADGFDELLGPEETGEEGVWRITGIRDHLTVRVRSVKDLPAPEAPRVTFVCDPEVAVWVYPGEAYSSPAERTDAAYALTPDGEPAAENGQADFLLTGAEGWETYEITLSSPTNATLLRPRTNAKTDVYRILGISEDLTVTVRKVEHTPEAPRRENVIPATCTEDGSYDEVIVCADCGLELSRTTVVLPAGHDWGEWTVAVEATETAAGLRMRVCKADPTHIETEEYWPIVPEKREPHLHLLQRIAALFRRMVFFVRRLLR